MMHSLRKWLYRPKRTDTSLLAQFYYADDELNSVADELDSFDGRKDTERCTTLVNQLRTCQNKVLSICNRMMDEVFGEERVSRDFRAKFPDEVLQDNLAGQLWFGAECLAAGSGIMNRESDSVGMRPLAKAVTKSLHTVRVHLREQCLRSPHEFDEKLCEILRIFDRLFAEFELRYVSVMVPVKSVHEYSMMQDVVVLFSETVQRALRLGLLCQDELDICDPGLMFTIPRLAIVAGLAVFPNGPLRLDRDIAQISELFRSFKNLLCKIRELLWSLTRCELFTLERYLCSVDEPVGSACTAVSHTVAVDPTGDGHQQPAACAPAVASHPPPPPDAYPCLDVDLFVSDFYTAHPHCRRWHLSRTAWREREARLRQAAHRYHGNYQCDHHHQQQQQSSCLSHRHCRHSRGSSCRHRHSPRHNDCNSSDSNGAACSAPCLIPSSASSSSTTDTLVASSSESVRISRFPVIACRYGSRCDGASASGLLCSTDSASGSTLPPPSPDSVSGDRQTGGEQKSWLETAGASNGCCSSNSLDNVKFSSPSSRADAASSASNCSSNSCSDEEAADPDYDIALAIQAAEVSMRNRTRARFRDSSDLIHRLFVCISGVADQLQTNFAADLRQILKLVFLMNTAPEPSETTDETELQSKPSSEEPADDGLPMDPSLDSYQTGASSSALSSSAVSSFSPVDSQSSISHLVDNIRAAGESLAANNLIDADSAAATADSAAAAAAAAACSSPTGLTSAAAAVTVRGVGGPLVVHVPTRLAAALDPPPVPAAVAPGATPGGEQLCEPPEWVPDCLASDCMLCSSVFTVVRRRHHCRRCGGLFCGRCSGASVPLPRFGYHQPVRVCDTCHALEKH